MKNKKNLVYATFALQIIVGLLFLVAGAGKFLAAEFWIAKFSQWRYPNNFYLLIGIIEIISAILLFIPRFSKYAAGILMIVMIGAAITHILHQEVAALFRPGIFLILLSALLFLKSRTQ
ncbi:MAG: DoxX family protein [Calditrichae bacterium]|nr:DoxX family protein [Calditrichia bacterium]